MKTRYLTSDEIPDVVAATRYTYDERKRFHSRCMYTSTNGKISNPALSLPGGDIGDLALLYASGREYGFEVDYEKALECLTHIVGDQQDISACTSNSSFIADPQRFHLDIPDTEALTEQFEQVLSTKQTEMMPLPSRASAAIIYEGPYGLQPVYSSESSEESGTIFVLNIHKSLADERHKRWSEVLIEKHALKLYSGLDADYVYEVLSDMFDTMVLEILLADDSRLPIYFVRDTPARKIQIEEYAAPIYT